MKNNKIFGKDHHTNFFCRQFKLTAIGALLLTTAFPALAQDPQLLVCNNKGYILKTKTAAVGATTYKWYENGSEQTGKTGETLTIAAGKTPGVYEYVRAAINSDCEVSSNTFTVQVLALPAAPTINVSDICKDAGDLVFSISPAANTTYTWTKTAGANGVASGADNSTYTVSGASTGTTSVQAAASLTYNINSLQKVCVSTLSAVASGVVNPLPTVTQTGTSAFCGSDANTTLTVYAEVNSQTSGIDITWYSKSDGTDQVETGTTYTPTLTVGAADTYYVRATVAATTCASALTPVTGILNLTEGEIEGEEI